jgi:LDH2 family malate/lactate/ureidoglycolate dehydrogenase
MALIDGRWTFGQVIMEFATELAIEKARDAGTGFVLMYDEGHTGRMGAYCERAARAGMAAALWDGGIGGRKQNVAPYGGTVSRLGANPIAIGFPGWEHEVILLDFATSCSAEGKLRVARARGKRLPGSWIVDVNGALSDDPNDFYAGGALMPMGGLSTGHKGYALGFMVGLFGLLATMPSAEPFPGGNRWGTALLVIDIGKLVSLDEFRRQVDRSVEYVKKTPAMDGFDSVLYPGEFEERTRDERKRVGIDVPEPTWDEVLALVRRYGLESALSDVIDGGGHGG